MGISKELLAKAGQAASSEELLNLAKEEGITLTAEEAEKFFTLLTAGGEMSDDELEAVSGGKGKKNPDPRYKNGTHLWLGYFTTQNYLEVEVVNPEFYVPGEGWRYLVQPVGYDFMQNEYLETRKYVHTSDPGRGWHD